MTTTTVTPDAELRLSYTYLLEPRAADEDQAEAYSTAILIPKTDTVTIEAIQAAIKAALAEGVSKKWGGKTPNGLRNPLRDGDEKLTKDGEKDELYAGHMFLNAKGPSGGKEKPYLFNKNAEATTDSSVVYSGVFGRVSLQFYAYDRNGNRGIAASIVAFMSAERGDSLGGQVTEKGALSAFGVTRPADAAASAFTGGSTESDAAPAAGDPEDPWAKTE